MLKSALKKIVNRLGYDILHLPVDPFTRQHFHLLKKHAIDLIFDIGANTGQYAFELRKWGYSGRIVSFEPLPDACEQLHRNAAGDPLWDTVNTAIGDEDEEKLIHVSENSYSSSFLDILPRHIESAPESAYYGIEKVSVKKIDTVIDQYFEEGRNLFIKVDTQGYEKKVYDGCKKSLDKIKGFQMELSLLPLYEGEILMQDMISLLRQDGYRLMLLGPGHQDYFTGEILQVEAVFYK